MHKLGLKAFRLGGDLHRCQGPPRFGEQREHPCRLYCPAPDMSLTSKMSKMAAVGHVDGMAALG